MLLESLNVDAGASINYRLSPDVRHPAHLNDVLEALAFLRIKFGMKRYILVGHSAGATLALQAIVYKAMPVAVVCTEGIYDIPGLVEEYPLYRDFIEAAFDNKAAASPYHLVQSTDLQLPLLDRLVLIQSTEDELLSETQTERMCALAHKLSLARTLIKQPTIGKHDEVFTSKELMRIVQGTVDNYLQVTQ